VQQKFRSLTAPLLLVSLVSQGASQVLPVTPHPGDRVRVWATDGPHVGIFDSLEGSHVLLQGHQPLALAPRRRMEVSAGRKGHALEGAGLGFLVGGGLGALLAKGSSGGSGNMDYGAAAGALAIGVGVWVGSTILGGVLGSRMKSDRWRPLVPSPRLDRSRPTPESGVTPVVALVRIPIRLPL
jgi:hypothetical protein